MEMRRILSELLRFVQNMPDEGLKLSGLKKGDLSECSEILTYAIACTNPQDRRNLMGLGEKAMAGTQGKDGFYTKMFNEI